MVHQGKQAKSFKSWYLILGIMSLVRAIDGITCPGGWHLYEKGNRCFLVSTEETTWHAARVQCQLLEADLAVIYDEDTNKFVKDLLRNHYSENYEYFWIGLHELLTEGTFQWLENTTTLAYQDWAHFYPTDARVTFNCAYADRNSSFQWKDGDCVNRYAYVCQNPASSSLAGKCPLGSHYYQQHDVCLTVQETKDNWFNARGNCVAQGGDLVLTKNESKFLFLRGIMADQEESYWLALHDFGREGKFRWLTETDEATFFRWSRGEPNNYEDEDCVIGLVSNDRWNDVSCRNEFVYACEKEATDSPPTSTGITVTPTPDTCPVGWYMYGRSNTCFRFFQAPVSWYAARVVCKHQGGDLAVIGDKLTQRFILGFMFVQPGKYWIGLHDQGVEGAFHWLDDLHKANYFAWNTNETESQAGENCVMAISDYRMEWSKEKCYKFSPFLCERIPHGYEPTSPVITAPSAGPTEPCPPHWTYLEIEETCYRLSTLGATWSSAREVCRGLGGDLAVVKDDNAQIVIEDMMTHQKGHYWLGMHTIRSNVFVWLDETEEATYHQWAPGQPSKWYRKRCVSIGPDSLWSSSNCGDIHASVCERKAANVLTGSTTPVPVTGACPDDSWYYYPERQMCYGLFDQVKTWYEARDQCQTYRNGDLVVIKDGPTHVFVNNEVLSRKTNEYWIGYNDQDVEGEFMWVDDDTPMNSSWWVPGEPNDVGIDDCVHTDSQWPFRFKDRACGDQLAYVCQASVTMATTATMTRSTTESSTTTSTTSFITYPTASSTEPFITNSTASTTKSSTTSTTSTNPTVFRSTTGTNSMHKSRSAKSEELSDAAVIGIVLAGVVIVVAVVVVAVFLLMRFHKRGLYSKNEFSSEGFDNATYDSIKSDIKLSFANSI